MADASDTLFYFHELASVSEIAKKQFPPGAMADHLTSYGGVLPDSSQMSALESITGIVTATFGTDSEPCAFSQKFPSPTHIISFYANSESLVEAYWKSIIQAFQGIFVGEPLANPRKKQLPYLCVTSMYQVDGERMRIWSSDLLFVVSCK